MIEIIPACRSCAGQSLETVLDLGRVPLANALVREDQLDREDPRYPLTLLFCPDCSLAQIRETVAPELLFGEYPYLSSFAEAMVEHARCSAQAHAERLGLHAGSRVVEIASNDGYLLKHLAARGIPVLGIDPARNLAEVARRAGVPTLCEFFGLELAARLAAEGASADLILANNVLAHVADTNGMAAGIARLLALRGEAVLEFPYVGEMIDRVEFDTIYHEHLCYFSLRAAELLFARHGLVLHDVERLTIHGGSLRIYLRHAATAPAPSAAVRRLAAEEHARGVTSSGFYREFALRVECVRDELRAELGRRKGAGQRLAAYGASAKGSTLMTVCGLDGKTLDFVVDRSTVKQGQYTPGNHLPILAPDALLERAPDAVLLLTWNFADEIFRQQAGYLERGGTFIVPVPEVRTVGREVLG